jgi:class 3 adenylate cyclase
VEVKGLNCEDMAKKLGISVEVEMSMLFADIRGPTPLAESTAPVEFTRMIDRIYGVGINTGKAVFGTVGSDEGMIEITALGEPPT